MAGLQHITHGGRDSWRIRFYVNGKQRTIGLGSLDERGAKDAKENIEHLIERHELGRSPEKPTMRWLESVTDELHGKLSAYGLCQPRIIRDLPRTVVAYMREYIKQKKTWKKPANYKQAVDKLERFLGRDIPLDALTKGEVVRWQEWMINTLGHSANTAGQHVKRCKQIFEAAVDDELVLRNPFKKVPINLESDESKNRSISLDDSKALLDACPDQEWRVLFALVRFGGLRCPSEVLAMRWTDLNWDRNRLKAKTPKTERYAGKGEKILPIWPELRTELSDLHSLVQPGIECAADAYIIQRYRHTEQNLRTQLHRICDRAGCERWPKPFMNMRSTRRTELENSGKFANHVLNAWFGHGAAVAEKHYLRVVEENFEQAAEYTASAVALPVATSEGQPEPHRASKKQKHPGKTRV